MKGIYIFSIGLNEIPIISLTSDTILYNIMANKQAHQRSLASDTLNPGHEGY